MKKTLTLLMIFFTFAMVAIAQASNNFINTDRIANGIDTIQKFATDSFGRVFVVDSTNAEEVGEDYHVVSYNTRSVEPFEIIPLEEKFKNPHIKIYPNPVLYDATIDFPSLDMYYVSIINIKGDVVYDKSELLNSVRINWQDFPAGVYYARIVNMNSNALYSEKIIKQ